MPAPLRLLVIDDERVDRLAITRALEHDGPPASIDEVSSAVEALTRISATRYDCLLLAHALPSSSGLEVARLIRASGDPTPIVMLAGAPDDDLLQAAVDAGVTDVVAAGELSPPRLALRIRSAIRLGHAEAAAAHARDAAAQATRSRDDVLSVVSHDLRGPLHAITLACEALREEIAGDALRYLGAIERASGRAERLITDLLEASTIEAGALQLARASVDASALVRQAAADHELLARESGVRISTRLPDDPTPVIADRERVRQVLGNLIGNALKHARGTPIELSLDRREGAAVIAVRDQGPGISDAELPHVFDRYWTGRTKKGGAGLGLAIARGIVEAHGGRLAVASRPGDGSEFSFTLRLPRI